MNDATHDAIAEAATYLALPGDGDFTSSILSVDGVRARDRRQITSH